MNKYGFDLTGWNYSEAHLQKCTFKGVGSAQRHSGNVRHSLAVASMILTHTNTHTHTEVHRLRDTSQARRLCDGSCLRYKPLAKVKHKVCVSAHRTTPNTNTHTHAHYHEVWLLIDWWARLSIEYLGRLCAGKGQVQGTDSHAVNV